MTNPTGQSTTVPESLDWYRLSPNAVTQRLRSDGANGLCSTESNIRLRKYGRNELAQVGHRTGLKILLAQFQSSLVVLLLAAMVISALLGEISDSIAILAIIVLNTLLGFWQDYRAEKSLAELKKLSVPELLVRRDGNTKNILAVEIVPGDVILLQSGFFVPADCRLVESTDLSVDESALTGESLAVEKTIDAIDAEDLPIADQTNVGFMGTMVVRGHAVAVVTATGMNTQLGQIASSLQSVEPEPTPLQIRLGRLSRTLAVMALVIVVLVFSAGIVAGKPPQLMIMTALSLAVAIVPEGLPAVATVALAIGARRMFKQNALIRQLPAVETLGSVSIICSDKTGTLTQNRMTATILDVADCRCIVDERDNLPLSPAVNLLLIGGCLCNDAQLQFAGHRLDKPAVGDEIQAPVAVGEPTETALVEVASKFELNQIELQSIFPRIGEIAFDSQRKRMVTRHAKTENANQASSLIPQELLKYQQVAFAKGAVESVLEESSFVWADNHPVPLDAHWLARIEKSRNEMAKRGTRVLAVGFRTVEKTEPDEALEKDLVFVGLVGLTDPARPEAKFAVARCRSAGIRPIMITGDHPLTAISIANELGITDGSSAVTGPELNEMPIELLRDRVRDVSVFARVSPADKLHIVEALQHNQAVVAMTGDGVNDAPALKQANVGVAMGRNGTDVSKEAANVVLLDDNFATIVSAVEQGRLVYANVRKFVKYTMSSNVGEVIAMTLGVMLGYPLPLLPLQILWVNLVTDGLPGLALAVESVEKNTMNKPPISPQEPIFDRRMKRDVIWIGLLIGTLSLASGGLLSNRLNVDHWRTIIFSVLTFSQMGNAFACRSNDPLLFTGNTRPNGWLWGAIGLTCLLQIAVIYVAPLQQIFDTQSLSLQELLICFAFGFLVFGVIELQKSLSAKKRNG